VEVPAGISEAEAHAVVMERESVKKALSGRQPRKEIFVPARDGQEPKINLVV
jgi:hypothetical protein